MNGCADQRCGGDRRRRHQLAAGDRSKTIPTIGARAAASMAVVRRSSSSFVPRRHDQDHPVDGGGQLDATRPLPQRGTVDEDEIGLLLQLDEDLGQLRRLGGCHGR